MNTLYTFLGVFSVSLGVVGIFVPVWPTTPFVLLSVVLFSRTDKRFDDYILNNKWIGRHVRNYMERRQMNKAIKLKTIGFVWIGLIISMLLQSNFYIIILLGVIGSVVTIHIYKLKETTD